MNCKDVQKLHKYVSLKLMKTFLKIIIVVIILLIIVVVGLLYWLFSPSIPVDSQLLPTKIIYKQKSPDQKIIAEILEGKAIEGFNPLGSDVRFYLTLKYQNSSHLIIRELSEGFGTYEGGVFGVKWLDENRVYIERAVGDQKADLIYDITKHEWQDVKNK